MALRPFAKHQKRKADDAETPSAADEFAQFFSNDPRPDEPVAEAPPTPIEQPAPAMTMTEPSAAGWYPDSKDPGLMRYWDGFHLTGQTMRVDPARTAPPEAAVPGAAAAAPAPAPTPSATELLAPGQAKTPLLGAQLLPSATEGTTHGQPPASAPIRPEPSDATVDEPVAPRPAGEPPVSPGAPSVTPSIAPSTPTMARMASPVAPATVESASVSWAERTERAVARAQVSGTPEAWEEAAQAAAVVSEMALTMQVAAEVRLSAQRLAEAAEEAKRKAEEAEELAVEAQGSVQKTAQAAKEAADAAAAASRAATEARQKAERAAEATPRATARSTEAAEAAASAKRKAQVLEEIVTRAHQADTSEAWSEAHRSAERALEQPSHEVQVAGS